MMEDLIENNMGLVISIVNKFNPKNQTERDAYIQAGRIGLWKALKKFRPEMGTKFSPYAWKPIRWEIIKEIRSQKDNKHLPLTDTSFAQKEDVSLSYMSQENFWEIIPSTLTDNEHRIIKLRLEGYTLKEIADSLETNRSNIRKSLEKAMRKIRDKMDE
jgi:RNA polymerase sporulation-specific sigma factor